MTQRQRFTCFDETSQLSTDRASGTVMIRLKELRRFAQGTQPGTRRGFAIAPPVLLQRGSLCAPVGPFAVSAAPAPISTSILLRDFERNSESHMPRPA